MARLEESGLEVIVFSPVRKNLVGLEASLAVWAASISVRLDRVVGVPAEAVMVSFLCRGNQFPSKRNPGGKWREVAEL